MTDNIKILVTTDINWDSLPILLKCLKSIKIEATIYTVYGKTLQNISKACEKTNFALCRREINKKMPEKTLLELINICDMCITFHNFTEYNTISEFVINTCKDTNVPSFIFTEYIYSHYFNGLISSEKFRHQIKKISKREKTDKITSNYYINLNFIKNYSRDLNCLRESYNKIKINKLNKQIKCI
tara:strand:- start:132 stop:686 length:555 start_codon:yes stop_codon:yes gene_type:complete